MADDEVTPQAVTDDFTDLFRANYEDGLNGVVVNGTFTSTGIAAASANGEVAVWYGDATFVGTAGAGNASGNDSSFGASVVFSGEAGAASASGNAVTIIVNQADARITYVAGNAPAAGYDASWYLTVPNTLEAETYTTTDTSALVSQDPFRRPNLEIKSGVSIKFTVDPWRVREGIPLTEANYLAIQEVECTIGSPEEEPPFVAPEAIGTISSFRWLPSMYMAGEDWLPLGAAPGASKPRSWEKAAQQFNWYTAALRSWAQLAVDSTDNTVPQWLQVGTDNPVKSPGYTYWRVNEYVTNTALLCNADNSMELWWAPPADALNQPITLSMVVVPRVPISGSFVLMRSGPDISLVLNGNSTLDLMLGQERITIDTVGSRVRSNEPIVVAVQIFPAERKVMTGVMDSMIRTATTQISQSVAMDPTKWQIGIGDLAGFEILEVNMYRAHMSERELASVLSVFDRIYGVTL